MLNIDARNPNAVTLFNNPDTVGRDTRVSEIKTALNHGWLDDNKEEHCCGCWHVVSGHWQDLRAICNECGEERDLAPLLADI